MPFRKVEEKTSTWDYSPCRSPEHRPSNMICIPPGEVWEWECPACGDTMRISGPKVTP
jgi:hypothetical protein